MGFPIDKENRLALDWPLKAGLGVKGLNLSALQVAMCREEDFMATLELGINPQEWPPTGTVKLTGFSGNQLSGHVHVLTGIPRGREWRVQESAGIRLKRQQ